MSVGRDVYFSLVGRSLVDCLLNGRSTDHTVNIHISVPCGVKPRRSPVPRSAAAKPAQTSATLIFRLSINIAPVNTYKGHKPGLHAIHPNAAVLHLQINLLAVCEWHQVGVKCRVWV